MELLQQMSNDDKIKLFIDLNNIYFFNKYSKYSKYNLPIFLLKNFLLNNCDNLDELLKVLYSDDFIFFMRDLRGEVKYFYYPDNLELLTKHEIIQLSRNRFIDYKNYFLSNMKKNDIINKFNRYLIQAYEIEDELENIYKNVICQ